MIREEWEREMGIGISEEIWQNGLEDIDKQSVNTRLCLIQFKVLHRLHFSKKKLHRIFPNVSPLCDKCKSEEADLAHSFIFCHKIQGFWCEVFKMLSDILNVNLEPDPVLIILGHSNHIFFEQCPAEISYVLSDNSQETVTTVLEKGLPS